MITTIFTVVGGAICVVGAAAAVTLFVLQAMDDFYFWKDNRRG
jgi:hypothetical protein